MTHEESWNAFIEELRAYVLEHHHGFGQLTNREQFLEVANMRDMEEHTGGRRKVTN